MNLWGNGYDFARIWQSAEKIVFSTTLTSVSTTNTRIERVFDAESVRLDLVLLDEQRFDRDVVRRHYQAISYVHI
jgi:hypothetical protein